MHILICFFVTLALFHSSARGQSDETRLCVRSVDSAKSYLEYRQCAAMSEWGIPLHLFNNRESAQFHLDFFASTIKKMQGIEDIPCQQDSLEVYELMDAGIKVNSATKYDIPDLLIILNDRKQRIRSILREDRISEGIDFILGTLIIGELTASVITVPNEQVSEHIIVFDAGLMSLTWLLSKIIGESVSLTSGGDFNRSISNIHDAKRYANELVEVLFEKSTVLNKFTQLLFNYVVHEDPYSYGSYPCYDLDDNSYVLSRVFNLSLELFLLGHEVSHITERHPERVREPSYDPRGTNFFHEMEYEADEIGFQMAKRALEKDGFDISVAVSGPTIFLMAQELTCRAWHILGGGSAETYGGYPSNLRHPPPKQRIEKIHEQIRRLSTPEAKRALAHSAALQILMNVLWFGAEPAFQQAQKEGVPPRKTISTLASDCGLTG